MEIDDEIIATLSDYLDGSLAAERRAEVEAKLADDEAWQHAHAELTETRAAMSSLQRARAPEPERFARDVTWKIHKRSAGRFFAKRTLGDRVPFGALLIVAAAGLLAIAYLLWASPTGSLKPTRDADPPPRGSQRLVPLP